VLTAVYRLCGDASDGPLTPGDVAQVVDTDESTRPYKVTYKGREWWYAATAVRRVPAPNPMHEHAGDYRLCVSKVSRVLHGPSAGAPIERYCGEKGEGLTCQHGGGVLQKSHWSCCGRPNVDDPCVPKGQASQTDLTKMWKMLNDLHQSMRAESLGPISIDSGKAMSSTRDMYEALVKYEAAIKPQAQSQLWASGRRRAWMERVIGDPGSWSLSHFASCLLTMEESIKTEAQEPLWVMLLRDEWVKYCRACGGASLARPAEECQPS
jgi:hypothetical protein